GLADTAFADRNGPIGVGRGSVTWLREDPAAIAKSSTGDARLVQAAKAAADSVDVAWRETNYLLLRRGPYLIAAGLDESVAAESKVMRGQFVNLFDSELKVRDRVELSPGSRALLLDLQAEERQRPGLLAAGCRALPLAAETNRLS